MMTKTLRSESGVVRRVARYAANAWLAAGLLLSAACDVNDDKSTSDDDVSDGAATSRENASGDGGRDATTDDASSHDSGHVAADGGDHTAGGHPCGQPYPKDPRDDTMTGELVHVVTGDNGTPNDPSDDPYDVLLPQEMLDWLAEQGWIQQHGDWHNVRRCSQACQRNTGGFACQTMEALAARGLSCAALQEGDPGDGYAFLIMHRHMIRGFQQAFPKHVEQIRGFYRVPTGKDDPENPIPWVDVRWSDAQLEIIEFMENIGQHLDAFTSEDDYAKWTQFGDGAGLGAGGFPGGAFPGDGGFPGFPGGAFPGGAFPGDGGIPAFPGGAFPGGALPGAGAVDGGVSAATPATGDGGTPNRPGGGIHGGLHGQWAVPGSPSSLVDNNKNVQNYAFWRLHVWMDDMWERYRRASGLGEDAPDYQQALIEQCEEMHELGKAPPPDSQDAGMPSLDGGMSAPAETGAFATDVAPAFTSFCGGSVCHGADSPTLGLVLAGAQPSVIREGLVGQQASETAMALVEPGQPERSWLYLKVTGDFDGVDCSTTSCTAMPPAGMTLSSAQVESLRSWIAAGATAD